MRLRLAHNSKPRPTPSAIWSRLANIRRRALPGFSALPESMSGFTAGAPQQAALNVAGQRIAANICYEDVFGEEFCKPSNT